MIVWNQETNGSAFWATTFFRSHPLGTAGSQTGRSVKSVSLCLTPVCFFIGPRWWWPTPSLMRYRSSSAPRSRPWTSAWSWPRPSAASTTGSRWPTSSVTSPWTTRDRDGVESGPEARRLGRGRGSSSSSSSLSPVLEATHCSCSRHLRMTHPSSYEEEAQEPLKIPHLIST